MLGLFGVLILLALLWTARRSRARGLLNTAQQRLSGALAILIAALLLVRGDWGLGLGLGLFGFYLLGEALPWPLSSLAAYFDGRGTGRREHAQSDADTRFGAQPAPMQPAQIEPAPIETHVAAAKVQTMSAYSAPPRHTHGGWLIQIGAFDDEAEAKQHLTEAQSKVHVALAAKDPFTQRVQKGDKALYRARFAGFDKSTAEAACQALKRSDFECMALKD